MTPNPTTGRARRASDRRGAIGPALAGHRPVGEVMAGHHQALYDKHPSVGAVRNLGLFGILDLVRSREPFTPLTPFNGTSDEM